MSAKPALKPELGLRDLTLFAISCITSARWIPIAAHAGPGSVTLWLLAAVFFMVPLTVAVAALVAKYPEFRDAFAGIVVRAVEPSGRDYGSMLTMKDIK